MRRRLFALTLSIAVVVQFAPAALATGPGGWNHLGHGSSLSTSALNGRVDALNSDNPGILYVGGAFANAGGKANADHLAKWDGSAWSAVNGSVTLNGDVDAIAYTAGHLYVGGNFTNVGGHSNINYLAEWTPGTGWTSPCLGTNPITAHVAALQIIGNTLYVAGSFADGAGIAAADFLVACDLTTGAASATVPSDGDFNSGIAALTADSNGTLYAGGGFINLEGVTGMSHVAFYQGGTWHKMGADNAVNNGVRSLTAHGTSVYIGTDAVDIAGIPQADHIAKWDAQSLSFSAMGSDTAGTNGWFTSYAFLYGMATSGSSLVFVGGSFQNANGVATADSVAYFDGTAWHPLGSDGVGNGPLNSPVNALAIFEHRVVAGGNFTNAGGDALADAIASHTIQRPDARIGTAASGPFVGNNVYSASGTGEAKAISVQRGHSGSLYVDIQNDGLVADILKVTGPRGANGFTLHYFHGTTNVTSQVLAGTYSTGSLAPAAHLTLRVVIHVALGSAASGAFLITARSLPGVPVDAVKAVVHAT